VIALFGLGLSGAAAYAAVILAHDLSGGRGWRSDLRDILSSARSDAA
jgi:hypothetical protein